MAQPSVYTEPLLHAWRLKVKAAASAAKRVFTLKFGATYAIDTRAGGRFGIQPLFETPPFGAAFNWLSGNRLQADAARPRC